MLRRPPSADPVPVVLAAAGVGPTLVVIPSVDDARLLGARLRRSGLSVAVVPKEWAAAAGGVDVVVGARAAAWAPMPEVGAIVVLDEHDEALQEERVPTWHARDVAVERASRAGAPCLLVSPVPSLAALARGAGRLEAPTRNEERTGWPILEIVDRTQEEPWRRSLVSSALVRHLRDPARRVVCVLNAPGKARRLACRSCRSLQRCERCQAAASQRRDGLLRCGRCGTERPVVCQVCGSSALAIVRPGVSTLRRELEAAANRAVVEVTAADEPLADGDAGGAAVLVGTEAVLHRVRSADTVAFLDIDAELLAPRFRADEQALALLARAARLVGPRPSGGRILVQTSLPHHEVLDAVLHADPGRLTAYGAGAARELGLPPATALAVLSGAGAEEMAAALDEPDVVRRTGCGRLRPGRRPLPGPRRRPRRAGRRPGRRPSAFVPGANRGGPAAGVDLRPANRGPTCPAASGRAIVEEREPTMSLTNGTTLEGFKDRFAGTVMLPGDAGYEEARAIWNGSIDRRPAGIARATTPSRWRPPSPSAGSACWRSPCAAAATTSGATPCARAG